jgi:multidrug efflux pump subunit AcrA (membrane-fusion protein)
MKYPLITSLLLFLLITGCSREKNEGGKDVVRSKVLVKVAQVKRETIRKTLSYYGNVGGVREAIVYTDVPGKLLRYEVKEGDRVKKDEIIAYIERKVPGLSYEPYPVKSPISGVIGTLYLKPGQMAAPQIPIAFVSDISELEVTFEIPETDVVKIKRGSKVIISLDREIAYGGFVYRVSSVVDPLKRTSQVKVRFNRNPKGLKPGMLVKGEFVLEEHKDALVVPENAIVEEGKDYFVFVVDKGIARKRKIVKGIVSRGRVEILEGLKELERVVTLGASGLEDGQPVEVGGGIE